MIARSAQFTWVNEHFERIRKQRFSFLFSIAQSIYSKPYKLVDLTQIPDEQLKQYQWLSLLGLVMKHIRDHDFLPILKDMIHLLQRIESTGGSDYIYRTLTYVTEAGEIRDPEEFVKILRQGLEDPEEKVMTLAEHWKQEGLAQGIEQGMERGIEQGIEQGIDRGIRLTALNFLKAGLSIEQVSKGTGLSVEEVGDIRCKNFS
ncbi:MAG: Rpn family recombination-promoting nuclease/putative transposase [Pseudomonadota bacterium]